MTTIAAISAIFAACSCGNGENTSAEVNLASLSGTYSGYSLATCQMFTDMLATDQTLTVTDNGDETLSISYTSDMFGEFSMPSCTVTASDGISVLRMQTSFCQGRESVSPGAAYA